MAPAIRGAAALCCLLAVLAASPVRSLPTMSALRGDIVRGATIESASIGENTDGLGAFDASPRLVENPLDLGLDAYKPPEGDLLRVNRAKVGESVGEGEPDIRHTAGYFRLNRTHDARLFYFYFESRGDKDTAPLVLWMTGGPGCSSEIALFFENGPFTINNDNASLSWNPYGWDMVSNIIYVDQPVNTGFSYSSDPRDMRHTENGVSQDMYEFLQEFFLAHPELQGREFYITGESYGGHYIPAVADRVVIGNRRKEGLPINLKGVAIGNGMTHPEVQFPSYPVFAHSRGLLSDAQLHHFQLFSKPCHFAAHSCGESGRISCGAAFIICEQFWSSVYAATGSGTLNPYDVRIECGDDPLCYDMSAADKFLALPWVRKALGVGDRKWESCSSRVYHAMLFDFMRDLAPKVPHLLAADVRVLVYAGDADYICNWIGNSWWVNSMKWPGMDRYAKAPWQPFVVNGQTAGSARIAEPLSFLRVHEAGHMVPMDQPEASLEMLRRFILYLPLLDGADYESRPNGDLDGPECKESVGVEMVGLDRPVNGVIAADGAGGRVAGVGAVGAAADASDANADPVVGVAVPELVATE
ncbi:unnamed protein product [Closterium sp. NIES-65]|nr:unnamed protein product [Closterium sp. NIES-65]